MAAASVNLDTGTGSGGTYASELVIPAVTGTTLNRGAAADQQAVNTLGATFGSQQQAFIRYDLGFRELSLASRLSRRTPRGW